MPVLNHCAGRRAGRKALSPSAGVPAKSCVGTAKRNPHRIIKHLGAVAEGPPVLTYASEVRRRVGLPEPDKRRGSTGRFPETSAFTVRPPRSQGEGSREYGERTSWALSPPSVLLPVLPLFKPNREVMDKAASWCGPRRAVSWLTAETRVQTNRREQAGDAQPRSLLEKSLPQIHSSSSLQLACPEIYTCTSIPSPSPSWLQHCYWPSSSWAGHCG